MFFTLMILAMLAAAGVLGVGLFSMVRGGEFNEKYGNKLMRWRIVLQGAALFFMAAALLAARGD